MNGQAALSLLGDGELRRVATSARALLLLHAAREYGFVRGGPSIDVDRCEDCLALAGERDVLPTGDEVDAAVAELIVGLNAEFARAAS